MKNSHASNDTRDQLRALIQRHSEQPTTQQHPAPSVGGDLVARPWPNERCTVRLLPAEIQRVNAFIAKAIQETHERVTVTDVLRIGLQRLDSNTPITEAEISTLRATDGRRFKRHKV